MENRTKEINKDVIKIICRKKKQLKEIDSNILRITICENNDLNKNDIIKLVNNRNLKVIQISEYIPDKTIKLLNEILFSERSDIEFRIFGFYSQKICDLSFLQQLTNIVKLSIDCIANVSNLDVLENMGKLEALRLDIYDLDDYSILKSINAKLKHLSLSVGERTSKYNCDCEWLLRFSSLETLYLGKLKKNITSLSALKFLKRLTLRGITVNDLSFINILQLEHLAIHWGAINNFEELNGNPHIKSIELWRIRKLSDISFLNNMPKLERIKLDQLVNIQTLPLLSDLKNLKTIVIDDLKKLNNISSLEYVENLENIEIYSGISIVLGSIIPLLNNKSIKEISCYTGNDKKNQEIFKTMCRCR